MNLFKRITMPLRHLDDLFEKGLHLGQGMIWCFLLTILGCSKDQQPLDELPDSPQFFLNGRIGADTLSIQAGVNQVYLYTHLKNAAEPVWQGVFSTCNTQDCPGTLSISLTPALYSTNINTALLGQTFFATDTESSVPAGIWRQYHFIANTVAEGTTLSWRKDVSQSWNSAPAEIYYFSTSSNPFTLTLQTKASLGWNSSVSQQINPDTVDQCDGINLIAQVELDTVYLSTNMVNAAAYSTYSWVGPGANFGTNQQYWPYLQTGIYTMNAINSTESCRIEASLSNLPSPGIYQTIDFSVTSKTLDPTTLNLVDIQWIAPGGQIFKSKLQEQPFGAFFEVLEQEEYQRNEAGNRTQLIKVKLNCLLYTNSPGNYPSELPFYAEGVIAVAVPD
jgi:hypothetical protein